MSNPFASVLINKFPEPIIQDGITNLYEVDPNYKTLLGDYADHPAIVYYANNRIVPLLTLMHSKDCVEKLNEQGLHIYLYEPLCSYIVGDSYGTDTGYNCGFYSEFTNDDSGRDLYRSSELDSILIYVENNGLKNVTVHTGDYDAEYFYPKYTDHFDIVCDDLFLSSITLFENIKSIPEKTFNKRFISTNWRFTPARYLMATFLTNYDTHLSWYFSVDHSILEKSPWLDYPSDTPSPHYEKVVKGVQVIEARSPYMLDIPAMSPIRVSQYAGQYYPIAEKYDHTRNPVVDNNVHLNLADYYSDCFVDVVTESRYAQPTANISEKTFQAMQFMTPFILVAPPNSLEYIKELGFKTFDRWWDESYDSCTNHNDRLHMIYDLIDEISKWSDIEVRKAYEEMKPVLEHNFNRLIEISKHGKLLSIDLLDMDRNLQWQTEDSVKADTIEKSRIALIAGSDVSCGLGLDGTREVSDYNIEYSISTQIARMSNCEPINIAKPGRSITEVLRDVTEWVNNVYNSSTMDLTVVVVWEREVSDVDPVTFLMAIRQVQLLCKANKISYVMASAGAFLDEHDVEDTAWYIEQVQDKYTYDLTRPLDLEPSATVHGQAAKMVHRKVFNY